MALLSRTEILEADDITTERVDVPEWGGEVIVTALNGQQRDLYEASMRIVRNGKAEPDPMNFRAKLVARALVDEQGVRLFTEADINALAKKNAAPLDRLFDKAVELSGMAEDSVDEAEGNSDAAPSGDSTSNSPRESSTAP